jgi:hypothetical protein
VFLPRKVPTSQIMDIADDFRGTRCKIGPLASRKTKLSQYLSRYGAVCLALSLGYSRARVFHSEQTAKAIAQIIAK